MLLTNRGYKPQKQPSTLPMMTSQVKVSTNNNSQRISFLVMQEQRITSTPHLTLVQAKQLPIQWQDTGAIEPHAGKMDIITIISLLEEVFNF